MNCRGAVAVVLLVLFALEILPCAYIEVPTTATSGSGRLTCRFEPLQVCGQGDSFFGALANLPVLVPGGLVLVITPLILRLGFDSSSYLPDGFTPPIDRPPQLSA